jgi:A/G-specific adenine glycosylase
MLQQTQVETVIPYFERFLSRFPSVEMLAAASQDDVLKTWENMGYYARARNLHQAAGEIVKRFNGRLPDTWDELTGLPGIGTYTAGAILSIAFGQAVPAVDGNVKRLMSRLFAIKEPLENGATQGIVRALAEELVPSKDPGGFNQALMDMGANVCTPRQPRCSRCPVSTDCEAHRDGLQDLLPLVKKRGPLPHAHVTAAVIWDESRRLLITQRPDRGLLGGLWKLPGGPQRADEEPLKQSLRTQVLEELGVRIQVGKPITSVKHAYTHFRITLHAFDCTHRAGKPKALGCPDWRWAKPGQLNTFAFSKADREIIKAVISNPQVKIQANRT